MLLFIDGFILFINYLLIRLQYKKIVESKKVKINYLIKYNLTNYNIHSENDFFETFFQS